MARVTMLADTVRDMVATALHASDFRQWLANKQPDEIVGHGASTRICPLGKFLVDKIGVAPFVTNETVMWHSAGAGWMEVALAPEFARFVARIDAVAPNGRYVTAETALQILDEVLSEP